MKGKALSMIPLLVAAIVLFGCGKKGSDIKLKEPDFKKYPFKSAVVEYTFSGDASGKMMQYIDHYGVREATEDKSTVKFMGQEQKNNTMTIFDQDSLFMIDLQQKTGTRMKNPNWEPMINQFKGMNAEQKKNFAIESIKMLAKQQGLTPSGTEQVMGHACDVFEGQGYRFCYWNGLLLKMNTSMGGMKVDMVASKFEEDVDIPAEKFMPPMGVKMQVMDPHTMMGGGSPHGGDAQGQQDAGQAQQGQQADPHAGMETKKPDKK